MYLGQLYMVSWDKYEEQISLSLSMIITEPAIHFNGDSEIV